MSNNQSVIRSGLSVLGKLFVGTRKGPSGGRARHLRKFQGQIGVRFTDVALLEQALTHRSYSHVTAQTRNDSNERMEFLGDSVLGLSVSQFLYLRFPDRSEGALSKMKSLLVSRKVLSSVARELGMGEFLLLSGEESEMGGRERASILADSFEGVIGAIYLDQGYRSANKFIQRFLLASITDILEDVEHTNYKSLLQEYVQSKRLSHPVYRVRKEEGPEHEKEFAIDVVVKGQVWGTGRGKSKKDAEQAAARSALEKRQGRGAAGRGVRPSADGSDDGRQGRRRSEPAGETARTESGSRNGGGRGGRGGRGRGRGRREEAPVETVEAKDRGGHGIAASREKLKAQRQEESEERKAQDRARRSSRDEEPRSERKRRDPDGRSDTVESEEGRSRGRRGGRGRRGERTEIQGREDRPERGDRAERTGRAERPEGAESVEASAPEHGESSSRPRRGRRRRTERDRRPDEAVPVTETEPNPSSAVEAPEETEVLTEPAVTSEAPPSATRIAEPEARETTGFVRRRRRSQDRPRSAAAKPNPAPAETAATSEAPAVEVSAPSAVSAPPVEEASPPASEPLAAAPPPTEPTEASTVAPRGSEPTEPFRAEPAPVASAPEASDADSESSSSRESAAGGDARGSFTRRKRRAVKGLRRR